MFEIFSNMDEEYKISINDSMNRFLNQWLQSIAVVWLTFLFALVVKCIYMDVKYLTPEEEEQRRKEQQLLLM